ncbi:hypothetical protein LTR60_006727, partial [Cryomyces antarcticus]
GAAFAPSNASHGTPSAALNLVADVHYNPKNPSLLKGGTLMTPSADSSRWVRRHVELRRPYLHVHCPDGDELTTINLTHSRIDHAPQLAKLLRRPNANVFAVYGSSNNWLFAARSEREKVEWILKIDQSYFSGSGTPEEDSP